ncbi:MAG: DUF58 domain-containing protein [Clostridia bacterium]|nr:DUF58 domain-containing protein [Clostridia bacterium]
MRTRLALPLGAAAVLAVTGFSTGSPAFLVPAVLILLLILLGGISVAWARRTVYVNVGADSQSAHRGDEIHLAITAGHRCPLPVAPLSLEVRTGPGEDSQELCVAQTRGRASTTLGFVARHVGFSHPGVRACRVEDLFGMFTAVVPMQEAEAGLSVLPNTFDLEPLTFAPCEASLGAISSPTEDASDPADIRSWRRGDALKKVHWKLSARRRTLLVRRFEEPTQPEALVLLDCTRPDPGIDEAFTRDAMVETAASVMAAQEGSNNDVRLPLWGRHPSELTLRMGLHLAYERLAQVDFSATEGFDRQLLDATRRLRQVGATVVITSRLSGRMLEPLISMRRAGPTLRLYLVSDTPNREDWQPLITRLQQAEIQVCSVTPIRE